MKRLDARQTAPKPDGVTVLLMLIHKQIVLAQPGIGMTGKAAWFIAVVIVPVVLLLLWRAGLLPPERVAVDGVPPDAQQP